MLKLGLGQLFGNQELRSQEKGRTPNAQRPTSNEERAEEAGPEVEYSDAELFSRLPLLSPVKIDDFPGKNWKGQSEIVAQF